MRRTVPLLVTGAVLAGAALLPSPGRADPAATFVFNGEGNRLNVYDAATGDRTTLIHSDADGDQGDGREVRDLNAQICFHEVGGTTYFIAGEDTKQGDQQGGDDEGLAGWGWFELSGTSLETFSTTQRGKLVPVYQADANKNENYGCGFLPDGRLLLTDVGNQQPHEDPNGQLHIWFPDTGGGYGAGYDFATDGFAATSDIAYCLIDRQVATAGAIQVLPDGSALVASARPGLNTEGWGIFRFANLPSSPAECSDTDGDGVLEATGVSKAAFIVDPVNTPTPNAVVAGPDGTFYVSSVFNGVIAQYSSHGLFMRRVLSPPPGEVLPPFSTGTPLGLGLTPEGHLWYADIGIVIEPGLPPGIGPGDGNGTVRRIDLGGPVPGDPVLVDDGLAFPDGIGVLTLD